MPIRDFSFHVYGRRGGASAWPSTSVPSDLKEFDPTTANLPVITSADALEVLSSSAADTAAGAGTRTVSIGYIDANNDLMVSTVALNGTAPVSVGAIANEVLWMEAASTGSSGVSAGDVSLRKVSGSVVVEQIAAGENKSRSARFMVPAGCKGFVSQWSGSAVGDTLELRLVATVASGSRALITPYVVQDRIFLPANGINGNNLPNLVMPALSRIKVSGVPGTASVRGDVSFTIRLEST